MNNLTRALTKREKVIVLAVMAAIIVLLGLTRPLWSNEYRSGSEQTSEQTQGQTAEQASEQTQEQETDPMSEQTEAGVGK